MLRIVTEAMSFSPVRSPKWNDQREQMVQWIIASSRGFELILSLSDHVVKAQSTLTRLVGLNNLFGSTWPDFRRDEGSRRNWATLLSFSIRRVRIVEVLTRSRCQRSTVCRWMKKLQGRLRTGSRPSATSRATPLRPLNSWLSRGASRETPVNLSRALGSTELKQAPSRSSFGWHEELRPCTSENPK